MKKSTKLKIKATSIKIGEFLLVQGWRAIEYMVIAFIAMMLSYIIFYVIDAIIARQETLIMLN